MRAGSGTPHPLGTPHLRAGFGGKGRRQFFGPPGTPRTVPGPLLLHAARGERLDEPAGGTFEAAYLGNGLSDLHETLQFCRSRTGEQMCKMPCSYLQLPANGTAP